MAKVDLWWDAADDESAPDFDALVTEFLGWRPAVRLPVLAIAGPVRRFYGSALFKAIRVTGLLRAVPFRDLPDADIAQPNVVILRWGAIAADDRARLPEGVRILNDTNLDTDKANVEEKFSSIAGYASFVDPLAGEGLAVVKSKLNARHDGQIHRLPLNGFRPEHFICQRLINNYMDDYVVDIRIPFVLGHPLSAYIKLRDRGRRFDNSNSHARLVAPSEVLTAEEISLCQRFCREIGLEYGELDILRDGKEGRIYIVDVNDTPAGPPKALPALERAMALRMIAVGFRQHAFGLPC